MNDEFYTSVIHDSPIGFLYLETAQAPAEIPCDFKVVRANPAFCGMTGKKADDLIGKSLAEILPDISDDQQLWIQSFEKAVRNNISNLFYTGLKTLSGLLQVKVLPSEAGCVTAFFSIMPRQTGREEHSNQNETIFNGTQDGLFLVEADCGGYRFVKCNRSFEKITGMPHAGIAGKQPEELFGRKTGLHFRDAFLRCLEKGQPISQEENVKLPVGDRFLSIALTPVFDNDDSRFIVGSIEDITQKKTAELEIKANLKLNKMLLELSTASIKTVDELLSLALEQAIHITESRDGYIILMDETQKDAALCILSKHSSANHRFPSDISRQVMSGKGIWGEAFRHKKNVIINDFNKTSRNEDLPSGHIPLRNFLSIPIVDGGQVVSVIGLANKKNDFTGKDVMLLNLVMNNVWALTQRKRSGELLKQEKDLFKTTLLSIGDAIMATDQQGKVILMNDVALQLTGWKKDDAIGRDCEDVFQIINEKSRKRCEAPISRVIRTGKTIALTNHSILISKDGKEYPITDSAAPIIGKKGEVKGVVLAFRDVTMEKQKVDAIRYLSYHDQLTGIFNRSFFEEEIKRLNTKRNLPISIVLADVNCLKLTNDAFGHATGDRILKKAARIIQNCCRQDDIFARVGGDEFAILLPHTSYQDAAKIVERIKSICTRTQTQSIALSISFGIATKETNLDDIRQVQKKAEDNMYKNKLFESPEMRSRTIQSVISKLYRKYTAERRHSQRVSRICEAMGRELNLNEREINDMKNAALLHDIGKIAIKSEILNKSTMLNDKEWSEIRRHPEVGYRLLSSLSDFSYVSECILAHHERYDGKGYPKGLKGKTIPVLPRIIALAEAFDTMTSELAYHKAISEEEALAELKRNAGTQFDPDLVDIFLRIHSNNQIVLK
jgi:diguanylate cyclase (GGDEF)-like protein/PAS domain S-box-containing protein